MIVMQEGRQKRRRRQGETTGNDGASASEEQDIVLSCPDLLEDVQGRVLQSPALSLQDKRCRQGETSCETVGASASEEQRVVLNWPDLPPEIQLVVLQSPALSLPDLARVASTSRLFREACLAREVSEEAWLSDLAASFFPPGLLCTFTRWLTIALTGAMECLKDYLHCVGEWPSESALRSTCFVNVLGLGNNSANSSGGHPDGVCSSETKFLIRNYPGSHYCCWMSDDEGTPLRVLHNEDRSGYDSDSDSDSEDSDEEPSPWRGLRICVEMRWGRHTAAYIALAHVACKTLASLGLERRYPWAPTPRHRLLVEQPAQDGIDFRRCPWSGTQRVPCAQSARALAALHCWNARHGESVPPLSLTLAAPFGRNIYFMGA